MLILLAHFWHRFPGNNCDHQTSPVRILTSSMAIVQAEAPSSGWRSVSQGPICREFDPSCSKGGCGNKYTFDFLNPMFFHLAYFPQGLERSIGTKMKWHLGLQVGNENLQTKHTYDIRCSYVNICKYVYTHMFIYLNLYTSHDS